RAGSDVRRALHAPLVALPDVVEQRCLNEIRVIVAAIEQPSRGLRAVPDVPRMLCCEQCHERCVQESFGQRVIRVARRQCRLAELANALADHARKSATKSYTPPMRIPSGLKSLTQPTSRSDIRMAGPHGARPATCRRTAGGRNGWTTANPSSGGI